MRWLQPPTHVHSKCSRSPPANASTEPPALISISLDANETLDPA
eukprot:COSAG06_NODE_72190_length_174_cov_28.853333_1_plen_43_part_10